MGMDVYECDRMDLGAFSFTVYLCRLFACGSERDADVSACKQGYLLDLLVSFNTIIFIQIVKTIMCNFTSYHKVTIIS